MSRDPRHKPMSPWVHNNHAPSGRGPSTATAPASNPHHMFSAQSSFDYNRTTIPGLSFPGSTPPWPADATTPSVHPTSLSLPNRPGQGPVAIPNAPVTAGLPTSEMAARTNVPAIVEDDTAEEGELTESAFEDIYEPSLETGEASNSASGLVQQLATDDEDYDPANPGSPIETGAPTETSEQARGRSRSYSPHLSPHEVEAEASTAPIMTMTTNGTATQPPVADAADGGSPSNPRKALPINNLTDARKKAQAAILRLWPLEVRYQDYVQEGIDKQVMHSFFTSLGLDTKSTTATHNEQHRIPQSGNNSIPKPPTGQATGPARALNSTIAAAAEVPKPTPKGPQEERKDRIARLIAEKNAKQPASAAKSTNVPSKTGAARPSAPSANQPTSTEDAAATEAARKRADKERLLQEKLDKLNQSRALRAQKKSEQTHAAQVVNLPEPSSVQVESQQTQSIPAPAPIQPATEAHEGARVPTQPAPPIPGLFLSTSGSPLHNPRKRPVASDLNESSPARPYKRTFKQHLVEKPLVIDVSDESDDEDIEMEISSPIDGPSSEHLSASLVQPKTASFRDLPPLTDKRGRRNLASPSSQASISSGAQPHNPAKLNTLCQGIDDLKQKIALLELQKIAKAASKESSAQSSSNDTPAAEVPGPAVSVPIHTSTHSASSSGASQQSPTPVVTDEGIQSEVPRASSSRELELAIISLKEDLQALEAKHGGKSAKARLLESEFARVKKEADELVEQRALLALKLEQLQAEAKAFSAEPEQTALPNGQQQTAESVFSPNGEEDGGLAAQYPLPGTGDLDGQHDNSSIDFAPSNPRIGDVALPSEVALARPDLEPTIQQQAPESGLGGIQPVEMSSGTKATTRIEEDTVMDEASPAEEPPQVNDDTNAVQTEDVMNIDTTSNDDETQFEPESPAEPDTTAQEKATESLRPVITDDTTPQMLASADSQESGSALGAIREQISNGTSDEGLNLLTQDEKAPHSPSKTGFVPYESMMKGFLSYRFHPNFHKDVAGGLRSATYSNKINPRERFCLDFLLGSCAKGGSCKYQHTDDVNIPDSQILLQLGNSERFENQAHEDYVSGLRSLLAEFKNKPSKDFGTITQAIIDYRSRFYGDQTRVLPLGDTGL